MVDSSLIQSQNEPTNNSVVEPMNKVKLELKASELTNQRSDSTNADSNSRGNSFMTD